MKGEIYEVDDIVLANLDILEGHPHFYTREKQNFLTLNVENGNAIEAYVYFVKNFKPHLLNEEMLETFSTNNPLGRRFVPREERDPTYDFKRDVVDESKEYDETKESE